MNELGSSGAATTTATAPSLPLSVPATTPSTSGESNSSSHAVEPASSSSSSNSQATAKPKRGSNKLDYLDGLRGYAALTVVIDHFVLFFLPSYYAACGWAGLAALAPAFYNGHYRLPASKAETLVFPFMDGTFSVAIFFVLSGRVLVASYLAKPNPPVAAIASATIRRLFRLGLPPLAMVLISWIMDTHDGFQHNAAAAAATLSPFGRTDVAFSVDPEQQTFRGVWRFLVALFTDNDAVVASPLTVTYRQQFTYMTSVLWTLRLEFRASMIIFFAAVVLKAVPPRSRWLLYGALIWWFHMENYHYLLFVLGMLLCDLEQTFAAPLHRLVTSRRWAVALPLWALRAALAYAWFAASWWQLKYLDDTAETRLVVGSVCALALLALTPPLQALFRSRPFHFLGYVSFSLYLWHLTVLFSLGSLAFTRLYDPANPRATYGPAVGAAAAATLTVAVAVAFVATKVFDEPSVKFAKWVFDALFAPYNEKNPTHRALRRAEGFAHQQLARAASLLKLGQQPSSKSKRALAVMPVPGDAENANDEKRNPTKAPMARIA